MNMILLFLLIAMLGASYYDFVISKKKIKKNNLEITLSGIIIHDDNQEYSIFWNEIEDIQVKIKKTNITKLYILTDSDKIDLSEYENLYKLQSKIKTNLNNL